MKCTTNAHILPSFLIRDLAEKIETVNDSYFLPFTRLSGSHCRKSAILCKATRRVSLQAHRGILVTTDHYLLPWSLSQLADRWGKQARFPSDCKWQIWHKCCTQPVDCPPLFYSLCHIVCVHAFKWVLISGNFPRPVPAVPLARFWKWLTLAFFPRLRMSDWPKAPELASCLRQNSNSSSPGF